MQDQCVNYHKTKIDKITNCIFQWSMQINYNKLLSIKIRQLLFIDKVRDILQAHYTRVCFGPRDESSRHPLLECPCTAVKSIFMLTMCAEQHIQNIIIVYFLIEIKAEIYQFNLGTEYA